MSKFVPSRARRAANQKKAERASGCWLVESALLVLQALGPLAFTAAYDGLCEASGGWLASFAKSIFSRFCHPQWVYIAHRKFQQNQSRGSGIIGGIIRKKIEIKILWNRFFFRVFVISSECPLRIESFVKIGRGCGVIRGDTHTDTQTNEFYY